MHRCVVVCAQVWCGVCTAMVWCVHRCGSTFVMVYVSESIRFFLHFFMFISSP